MFHRPSLREAAQKMSPTHMVSGGKSRLARQEQRAAQEVSGSGSWAGGVNGGGGSGRYGGGEGVSHQYYGRSSDRLPVTHSRREDRYPERSSSGADRFEDRSESSSYYGKAAGPSSGASRDMVSGAAPPRSRGRDDPSRERYHSVSTRNRSSRADQLYSERDYQHRHHASLSSTPVAAAWTEAAWTTGGKATSLPHYRGGGRDRSADRFRDRSAHRSSVGIPYSSRRGSGGGGEDGDGGRSFSGGFRRHRSDERDGVLGDRGGDRRDNLTGPRDPRGSRGDAGTGGRDRGNSDHRGGGSGDRSRHGHVSGAAKRRRSDEGYDGAGGDDVAPGEYRANSQGGVRTGGRDRSDDDGGGTRGFRHSAGQDYKRGVGASRKRHRVDGDIDHSDGKYPAAISSSWQHGGRNASSSRSRRYEDDGRGPSSRGGRAAPLRRNNGTLSSTIDGERRFAAPREKNIYSSRANGDRKAAASPWGEEGSPTRDAMTPSSFDKDKKMSAVISSSLPLDSTHDTRLSSGRDAAGDRQNASSRLPSDRQPHHVSSLAGRRRDKLRLGGGKDRDGRDNASVAEGRNGGRIGNGAEGRVGVPPAGFTESWGQPPREEQHRQQHQQQQQPQKQEQEQEQEERQQEQNQQQQPQKQEQEQLGQQKQQQSQEVQEKELPRHLLGQKPDFEAEGGGRGEELKFASDREEDPHRLAQRQKQIDFGKNTAGYDKYLATVPRRKRKREHPTTPNKYHKMSKRRWDGKIRSWRRQLHAFDTDAGNVSDKDSGSPLAPALDSLDTEQWGELAGVTEPVGVSLGSHSPDGGPTTPLDRTSDSMGGQEGRVQVTTAPEDPQMSTPDQRAPQRERHEQQAQEEQQEPQHINAGIYADSGDEDDMFGASPLGGRDQPASSDHAAGMDGEDDILMGEAKNRRRESGGGGRATAGPAAAAAMSPWETTVDRLSEDSQSDEEWGSEGDDGMDEGTGRRRRSRRRRGRRGWGEKRTSKLGGGEKLGRGELLAADEELEDAMEDEEIAESAEEDAGRRHGEGLKEECREGPGGSEGSASGVSGAGETAELRGGAKEKGLQRDVNDELHETVWEKEVAKNPETAVLDERAEAMEELELNADDLSDDDLL
ncbi:unnamed protein product [Scytosiphon promiscuus]